MKFEKLKSGQILCTLSRSECGLTAEDNPAAANEKFKELIDAAMDGAKAKYGEEVLNDDTRAFVCGGNTGDNLYIAMTANKNKADGKHLNEIQLAIMEREEEYHHREETFCPLDDRDIIESLDDMEGFSDDIEEFYDEAPDLITELIMIAISFKRVTGLMNFLRANRHLLYVLSYAYKRPDGRYIFALKGTDRTLLSITEAKAVEFGAEPIKNPPSKEYMDEHYKRIDFERLMAIKEQ